MTVAFLIDTSVAVHLRDLDEPILSRLAELPSLPALSMISCVELESGVVRVPGLRSFRRIRVDTIYDELDCLVFGAAEREAYRTMIEKIGYSRPRLFDRMIAATALVHDLTLVTIDDTDFRDVPNLKLNAWPAPDDSAA